MFSKGRRSIRLPGFDYSQPGFYFVTVCSYRRQPRFGRIEDEKVVLSSEGEIVKEEWLRTETLRSEFQLDEYIIMPNHFHGIVIFNETSLILSWGTVISPNLSPSSPTATRSLTQSLFLKTGFIA